MEAEFIVSLVTAILYWGGVVVNATRIKRRTGNSPSLRPRKNADYLLWLCWASIIFSWSSPYWLVSENQVWFDSLVADVCGFALIIGGFGGTWWCYAAMGNAWAISVNERQTSRLVQSGPYRLVRHPIYALQWLVIFGNFLILPCTFLGVALAILTVAMQFKASSEEFALVGIFGDEYKEYSKRTTRFLPLNF
ncbi:MAG: isoprenylcysteine carboxylmethyltransferase family protein [Verrucomicrobiales bacterium]|nr:isoprenylcysteine carboxylmethyltransferase family protein [Verrucomicrobiales bacterium]